MKKYKSVEEFLNNYKTDLWNDCEKYLKTYAIEYCTKAADDLTETAKYAIEEFYNDYDERRYKRTNNLKNNSYKRYYKNNGKRVWGGVEISADNMDTYYRKNKDGIIEERDPFLVFSTAWESGLHGIYGWHTEEGKRGIVPTDIVNKKIKDKNFLKELDDAAYKKAKIQDYALLDMYLK